MNVPICPCCGSFRFNTAIPCLVCAALARGAASVLKATSAKGRARWRVWNIERRSLVWTLVMALVFVAVMVCFIKPVGTKGTRGTNAESVARYCPCGSYVDHEQTIQKWGKAAWLHCPAALPPWMEKGATR